MFIHVCVRKQICRGTPPAHPRSSTGTQSTYVYKIIIQPINAVTSYMPSASCNRSFALLCDYLLKYTMLNKLKLHHSSELNILYMYAAWPDPL